MKRYPMAHKINIPPGTERVDMWHTDVAATFKRIRKEQAAQAVAVPLRTVPALVVDTVHLFNPTRYQRK